MADHNGFGVGIEFLRPRRDGVHRRQRGPLDAAGLVFPGFAHVEQNRRLASGIGQPLLQQLRRDLRHGQKLKRSPASACASGATLVSNRSMELYTPSPVQVMSRAAITGGLPTT